MSGKGITKKRNGLILRELFKVLLQNQDGIQAKDAIEAVATRLELTDHDSHSRYG